MTPAAIISKLWNFCSVLRGDGMSYGDYVEQLTLKQAFSGQLLQTGNRT